MMTTLTAVTPTAVRSAPLLAPVAALVSALLLSGCGTIKPEPLTQDEIGARVSADRAAMYRDQQPVSGPLTLSDAMARALKYNLDYRLKMMETALSRGILDISQQDMLPKLMTDAGYRWRDNDSSGTSVGIEDRVVSLRPSTSEEREHLLADATFSWDVLDFGMSYYRAKQQADNVNIAEERRRKVLQNIVQEVRDAYWRALGAQRLLSEAQPLAEEIQTALEKTREAERAGILPPVEGLEYQRALLDAVALLNQKRQEMQMAKSELAALLNLPSTTDFTLQDVANPALSGVPSQLDTLEQMALERRPELREEDYKTRIDVLETKRQIASLFPNLNLFGGISYDSNSYLYNNSWVQGGVGVSMNLFKLLSAPAISRTNDARLATDNARRMALSMAVLTQVRVSVERYKLAVYDYQIAQESARVDQRLASISRAGSDNSLSSDLESLRTQARSIVSRFQEAASYAQAQSAYGRVLNSVGIDLLPEKVTSSDLPTLSREINQSLVAGEKQVFTQSADAVVSRHPVSVTLGRLPAGVNKSAIYQSVTHVLAANQLVQGNGADSVKLQMNLNLERASGSQRGVWEMAVYNAQGAQVAYQKYTSYLPNDVNTRSVSALAEAAALSVVSDLHKAAGDTGVMTASNP